jgi:hypothetical protein
VVFFGLFRKSFYWTEHVYLPESIMVLLFVLEALVPTSRYSTSSKGEKVFRKTTHRLSLFQDWTDNFARMSY